MQYTYFSGFLKCNYFTHYVEVFCFTNYKKWSGLTKQQDSRCLKSGPDQTRLNTVTELRLVVMDD